MNVLVRAVGDDSPAREALRERAVSSVAMSGAAGADPVEVHALWHGLVGGRYRLVEHFEHGGRRYYVVLDNLGEVRNVASLDARERRLAEMLGVGRSEKVAGYELGLTPSMVSALLKTTLAKLGLRSRIDLVLLVRSTHVVEAA